MLDTNTMIAASDIAPACRCGNETHTYHCSTSHGLRGDFALVARCYDCGTETVLGECDDAERYTTLTAQECRARHEEYARS